MDRELPQIATLKWVNKTGHDVIVKTQYNDNRNVAPITIEKEKNEESKAYVTPNQNLSLIKEYQISYAHGQRSLTGGSITVNAASLSQELTQYDQSEAVITIRPSTRLRYVTGFVAPQIGIRKSAVGKTTEFSMEGSFIAIPVSKDIKAFNEQLGLAVDAQPNEIFGLGKPPKMPAGIDYYHRPKEIDDYIAKLAAAKKKLLERYADNFDFDLKMYQKYKITEFSRKMRDYIISTFASVSRMMGLE